MTKIQLRRDTAANWEINDPTPSAGEPCFETDTGKLKIGDGITTYCRLPYQGGTSGTLGNLVTTDTTQTISGVKTFTGTTIFKGKSLNIGDDNEHSNIACFSGGSYIVGDEEDTTIFNPVELGTSYNNTVLKSTVRVLEFDTASSTKKAYRIMTKSPTNNEYMAHMAMPSDKYIDLELGATGTTYTAPSDGWFLLDILGSSDYSSITIEDITNSFINSSDGNKGFSTRVFLPTTKGHVLSVRYSTTSLTVNKFRFYYAIGSEPTE